MHWFMMMANTADALIKANVLVQVLYDIVKMPVKHNY